MGFRIVTISHHCKLEFGLNYLVMRSNEKTNKVRMDEISLLIVENTAVSITAVLLQELINRNIDVIFCDNKRNPNSFLLPLYGSHDTSDKINIQILWSDEIKKKVWTEIIKEKVKKQGELLKLININDENYFSTIASKISLNDEGNIEAQSAKKYFHLMFGPKFVRKSDTPLNSALNYGYGILLSVFNREIVKNGYITQLGIGHCNVDNRFNLGCDFMEPFRPLIDYIVRQLEIDDSFTTEHKHSILALFSLNLIICGKSYSILNVIEKYCASIFHSLEANDINLLEFYDYGKI